MLFNFKPRPDVNSFFAGLILAVTLSPLGVGAASHISEKTDAWLDVGNRRQLFIDGRFFASSKNVELVVHPPRKTGERTLVPERPWEEGGFGSCICVMHVEGVYHLWYPTRGGICYARSKDGIGWERPNLGLAEYEGSRDNNIVVGRGAGGIDRVTSEGTVFYDPTAPKDQRFRYAVRLTQELKDTVVFSSPDGIHWRLTHKKVLTYTEPGRRHHLDSQNVMFWDDRISKYVAYFRRNLYEGGSQGRSIARSESEQLGGFAEAQEAPVVLAPDSGTGVDYYASAAIKYPWAQDAYYMFPHAYFHFEFPGLAEFRDGAPLNAGPIDTQFAASRDGITWHYYDRRPFVPLGMKGESDSLSARIFHGLVPSVDGREMYLYYRGSDQSHGWGRDERNNRLLTAAGFAPTENTNFVSRLTLRRDGFVSARAAYAGGEFTTPPLGFKGRKLTLNINTSATGIARVACLDKAGKPIPGFTLEDCDIIHTANEINRTVTWKGRSDLRSLADKTVRLHFAMRGTDLYAFQFP